MWGEPGITTKNRSTLGYSPPPPGSPPLLSSTEKVNFSRVACGQINDERRGGKALEASRRQQRR